MSVATFVCLGSHPSTLVSLKLDRERVLCHLCRTRTIQGFYPKSYTRLRRPAYMDRYVSSWFILCEILEPSYAPPTASTSFQQVLEATPTRKMAPIRPFGLPSSMSPARKKSWQNERHSSTFICRAGWALQHEIQLSQKPRQGEITQTNRD